jgi:hypothetical protein
MRTLGVVVAVLAIPGVALAQPGGRDLPVDQQPPYSPMPGGQQEPQPPQGYDQQPPMEAMPPQPPPAQVLPTTGAPARATFMSTSQQQWNVWVDQQLMCTTPCTLALTTAQFVALKTQDDQPIRLDVGNIPAGDVMVRGKPLQSGLYATGITFTALSGAGLATGITLFTIGAATGRDGMRNAGLYTGIPCAVGLYASIYLMRKALPKVSVGPATPYATAGQVGLAGQF